MSTNGNSQTKWIVGIVAAALVAGTGLWVMSVADTATEAKALIIDTRADYGKDIALGKAKDAEIEKALEEFAREQRYQRRLLEALVRNQNIRVDPER